MSDSAKLPKGAIAIDRGPHDAVIILDGTYAATVPKRLADAIEALQKTQQPGMWIQAYCYVGSGHYFNAYVRSGEPTPMYCNEHLKATEQPKDSAPNGGRCMYHGTTFEECAKRSREVYGFPDGFEPCRIGQTPRAKVQSEGPTPTALANTLRKIQAARQTLGTLETQLSDAATSFPEIVFGSAKQALREPTVQIVSPKLYYPESDRNAICINCNQHKDDHRCVAHYECRER